jgi:hypothetical protein
MSTPTSAQQQPPILADGDTASGSLGTNSNNINNNNTYANYPLRGVPNPHPHDVLCGRGGATNSHIGNSHWRTLVTTNKELYVTLPKRQKQLLSKSIVHAVRSQNPPGRFLQKDFPTGLWFDVGDVRAQEKTSQALREGAPLLRDKLKNADGSTNNGNGGAEGEAEVPGINDNSHPPHQHHPHHPLLPSVPPPVPAPVPVADPSKVNAPQKHSSCAAPSSILENGQQKNDAVDDHDDNAVPPQPSMLDPTGDFSFGTISVSDLPSEIVGLENGFSFGSVTSTGVLEEPSRYCASFTTAASGSHDMAQIVHLHQQQHQHSHQYQLSSRPIQRDSLTDACGRIIPPTALQVNELSFGSIIMTDAEQSRLETSIKQKQHQYTNSYAQPHSSAQLGVEGSSHNRFGRPTPAPIGDDVNMVHPVDGGLEPAGLSACSMMSMGTIITSTNLENAGMSLGSMISAVDGGLDAVGTSFGSMTIGGPNSSNTNSNNPLPPVAEAKLPLQSPPQPPMQAVPTFLRQKRSKGDLLECSDTESEDEEQSAQASAQKSVEWEKLKATFEAQMAGAAYNSAAVPPSLNNPIGSSSARAQQRTATEVEQQPLVLDIPQTGFGRDLSQMSACSVGDYPDDHHHYPAENTYTAPLLIGGQQQQRGNDSWSEMPLVPPSPAQGGLTRTESDELRALEVTLLNRGSSLAAEEFDVPRQPE